MQYQSFISPRSVKIGSETFAVSKIPALKAQEIYCRIMKESDSFGNLGYTMLKSETIMGLLEYAAAKVESSWVELDTESCINTYCKDAGILNALVLEMIQENYGFLFDGTLLKQLGALDKAG